MSFGSWVFFLFSVHNIALIGVLAAMVFALTKFVSIPIPSPLGKTALSVSIWQRIQTVVVVSRTTLGTLAAGTSG